jgi:benzodiazapine receptor
MTRLQSILGLLVSLGVVFFVAFIGGWMTSTSVDLWYLTLIKPEYIPPNWIFAPVWTTLYILMGVSAWLVWDSGDEDMYISEALTVYGMQLALNLSWSYFFFYEKSLLGGLVVIAVLWLMILCTLLMFWRSHFWAACMLIPYLLWVSFAAWLNYKIWQLNPL